MKNTLKIIHVPIILFLNYIMAFVLELIQYDIVSYEKLIKINLMNIYYKVCIVYTLFILFIIYKDERKFNFLNILLILTLLIKAYCIINQEAMDMSEPFTISLRNIN